VGLGGNNGPTQAASRQQAVRSCSYHMLSLSCSSPMMFAVFAPQIVVLPTTYCTHLSPNVLRVLSDVIKSLTDPLSQRLPDRIAVISFVTTDTQCSVLTSRTLTRESLEARAADPGTHSGCLACQACKSCTRGKGMQQHILAFTWCWNRPLTRDDAKSALAEFGPSDIMLALLQTKPTLVLTASRLQEHVLFYGRRCRQHLSPNMLLNLVAARISGYYCIASMRWAQLHQRHGMSSHSSG
jgi:hypothetical protein